MKLHATFSVKYRFAPTATEPCIAEITYTVPNEDRYLLPNTMLRMAYFRRSNHIILSGVTWDDLAEKIAEYRNECIELTQLAVHRYDSAMQNKPEDFTHELYF